MNDQALEIDLSSSQVLRYEKQLLLDGFTGELQSKLVKAKIGIEACPGFEAAAAYLVGLGVGSLYLLVNNNDNSPTSLAKHLSDLNRDCEVKLVSNRAELPSLDAFIPKPEKATCADSPSLLASSILEAIKILKKLQ